MLYLYMTFYILNFLWLVVAGKPKVKAHFPTSYHVVISDLQAGTQTDRQTV
jgi:hypothetical protein